MIADPQYGWYGNGLPPAVFRKPTVSGVGEAGPEAVTSPHEQALAGLRYTARYVQEHYSTPTSDGGPRRRIANALRSLANRIDPFPWGVN